MKLYSYLGQEPAPLPSQVFLENGVSVTSLEESSQEELISYGFSGPFEVPSFNLETQKLFWNGKEYEIIDLSKEVIEAKKIEDKENAERTIDKFIFYEYFKSTEFYKRIRKESSQDLKIAVLHTELFYLIQNSLGLSSIFSHFDKFCYLISFSENEIKSFQNCLSTFTLIYDVPEGSSKYYDFDTDTIVDTTTRPFESWIWNGTKWTAPVPYPNDKNYYVWNDKKTTWDQI